MKRRILTAAALWAVAAGYAAGQGTGASIDVETIELQTKDDIRSWWVKFVCGTVAPDATGPNTLSASAPLVPGTYRTAINVTTSVSVAGLKLAAAVAQPLDEPVGVIGDRELAPLIQGTAVEIDCGQIIDVLYPPSRSGGGPVPPFVKGFVRIFHPGCTLPCPGFEAARADYVHVAAVYTASPVTKP